MTNRFKLECNGLTGSNIHNISVGWTWFMVLNDMPWHEICSENKPDFIYTNHLCRCTLTYTFIYTRITYMVKIYVTISSLRNAMNRERFALEGALMCVCVCVWKINILTIHANDLDTSMMTNRLRQFYWIDLNNNNNQKTVSISIFLWLKCYENMPTRTMCRTSSEISWSI